MCVQSISVYNELYDHGWVLYYIKHALQHALCNIKNSVLGNTVVSTLTLDCRPFQSAGMIGLTSGCICAM